MERRTFLVGSAMALPMMAAGDKVNIAVIGVGGRGTAHVKNYLQIPERPRCGAVRCEYGPDRALRTTAASGSEGGWQDPKIYQDLRKL